MTRPLRSSKGLLAFYLIAFGGPWIGWTLAAILAPPRGSVSWWSLMLSGNFCSVAGFVAIWIDEGRAGLVQMGRRLIDVRHPFGWWLYALLVPVLASIVAVVVYGATHGGVGAMQPAMLLTLFGPASLLRFVTGPLGEEFGWRGYLLPRLLEKRGPLSASVIIGLIWGVWHLPAYYQMFFHDLQGTVVFVMGTLTLSVLMTVLFLHTRYALGPIILIHWAGNAGSNAVRAAFPDVHVGSPQLLTLLYTLTLLGLAVIVWCLFRSSPQMKRGGVQC